MPLRSFGPNDLRGPASAPPWASGSVEEVQEEHVRAAICIALKREYRINAGSSPIPSVDEETESFEEGKCFSSFATIQFSLPKPSQNQQL